MAFFAQTIIVGTMFGSRTSDRSARPTAARCAGWSSGCCWLALLAVACTPVGEVNKRRQQQAGASAASSTSSPVVAEQGGAGAAAGSGARSASDGASGKRAGADLPAGSGGAPATHGGGSARAGEHADEPAANGGSGGSAGRGSSAGAAGSAGSQKPSTDGNWFCMQVDTSCTCVQVDGLDEDSCSQPKPGCCFELVRLGTNACTCWPEDSQECKSQMSEVPDAKRTSTCPPR